MKYEIKSTTISKLTLSEDGNSISIDVTIFFGITGDDKMTPSSTGCTIELSLKEGNRNTLASELNEKTAVWFNEQFNS